MVSDVTDFLPYGTAPASAFGPSDVFFRMQLILTAMRRPAMVMVLVLSLALGCFLAVGPSVFQHYKLPYPAGLPKGMEVDIFPKLNLPVIYVCQPYGGMDPAQMEGFLTNYYEYHFLYISGIRHVESRNVQGTALMNAVLPSRDEYGSSDGRDDQLREPLAGLHAARNGITVRDAI